jgi:hypothetical protein
MSHVDNGGGDRNILSVMQNGVRQLGTLITTIKAIFPAASGTASSASAGAATLPANPVTFLVITLPDGTIGKVPVYGD